MWASVLSDYGLLAMNKHNSSSHACIFSCTSQVLCEHNIPDNYIGLIFCASIAVCIYYLLDALCTCNILT